VAFHWAAAEVLTEELAVTLPTVGWTIDLPVPLEQLLPEPWEREGEGWKEG
jgi:hypothetical protein